MLVLEKNSGQVKRIVNGSLLPESILSVNVSKESERGMLGISDLYEIITTLSMYFYIIQNLVQEVGTVEIQQLLNHLVTAFTVMIGIIISYPILGCCLICRPRLGRVIMVAGLRLVPIIMCILPLVI